MSWVMDRNSPEEYVSKKCLVNSFSHMHQLLKQGKLCDITLKVDNRAINAHRIVLAATIPFFRAMFDSNMVETYENDVKMLGIEFHALESFVHFAYSGRLKINLENAPLILAGASFLMLQEIEIFCTKYLQKRLNPENALEIKFIGDNLRNDVLTKAANDVIRRKFYYVTQSCAFKSLDPDEQRKLRKAYGYVPRLGKLR